MLNAQRAAVLAALLFALPLIAPAHERDAGQADDRLVDKFARFAGSRSNAESLVNGLRNDQLVKLTSAQQGSASFTPKTDRMGFGNVDNALALTQASLEKQGITNATPEQLKTALLDILNMRAAGEGWGEIAHSPGFNLAEIKSAQNRPERTARVQQARAERPDRAEKPDRVERMDRPMRPERPERPQK